MLWSTRNLNSLFYLVSPWIWNCCFCIFYHICLLFGWTNLLQICYCVADTCVVLRCVQVPKGKSDFREFIFPAHLPRHYSSLLRFRLVFLAALLGSRTHTEVDYCHSILLIRCHMITHPALLIRKVLAPNRTGDADHKQQLSFIFLALGHCLQIHI